MKIIGLTGSIGMGKSTTSKMFATNNIPVFDSDKIVHILMGPNGKAVKKVDQNFPGVKIAGQIDRKLLGQKVFGNDKALKKLEKILHPMVSARREIFLEAARNNKEDIVVFDIPLLFEKGYESLCDYIVVVSASFDIQKKRVLERAGMTEQRFQEIINKQTPNEEKKSRADFIIQTDKGLDYANQQVQEVIDKIRKDIHA